MMELINIQIIFLIVSFLLTAFTAIFPILVVWSKSKETGDEQTMLEDSSCGATKPRKIYPKSLHLSRGMKTCLSFANSFACGVFLAMCIISLVPASSSMWRKILNHNSGEHPHDMKLDDQNQNQNQSSVLHLFPWGEFLTLLGFTIIFMIEVLQGTSEVKDYEASPSTKPQSGFVLGEEKEGCIPRPTNLDFLRQRSMSGCCAGQQQDDNCDTALVDTEEFVNNYVSLSELKEYNLIASTDSLKGSPLSVSPMTEYGSVATKFRDKCQSVGGTNSQLRSKLLISRTKLQHSSSGLALPESSENLRQNNYIIDQFGSRNIFFLLLSVAIHNVFEGLTLGIQNNLSDATSIFIGISLHACLLSLVVSLTTLKAWASIPRLSLKKCAFIQFLMCLFRPIGIILGLLVQNLNDKETNVISAILMSLSTGVFLHVTFLSLIPAEFPSQATSRCPTNMEDTTLGCGEQLKEEDELEEETPIGTTTSSLTIREKTINFTLLKASFFVCGWLLLSMLSLFTPDHH